LIEHPGPALHPEFDGLDSDSFVLGAEEVVQVLVCLVGRFLEPELAGGAVVELPIVRVPAGPLLTGAGLALDLPGDRLPGKTNGPHLGGLGD
jgi:hypothetical protein